MKIFLPSSSPKQAFTLLEMSMVIMILLALISTGLFVSTKMDEWKLGREASESLRLVYSAQRMYLADNPTVSVSSLTPALIIPYLPNQAAALPTIKSLTGSTLTIVVTAMPPVVSTNTGLTYDPSNCATDSLWDVGP